MRETEEENLVAQAMGGGGLIWELNNTDNGQLKIFKFCAAIYRPTK
jgi:hypothetical protein